LGEWGLQMQHSSPMGEVVKSFTNTLCNC